MMHAKEHDHLPRDRGSATSSLMNFFKVLSIRGVAIVGVLLESVFTDARSSIVLSW